MRISLDPGRVVLRQFQVIAREQMLVLVTAGNLLVAFQKPQEAGGLEQEQKGDENSPYAVE